MAENLKSPDCSSDTICWERGRDKSTSAMVLEGELEEEEEEEMDDLEEEMEDLLSMEGESTNSTVGWTSSSTSAMSSSRDGEERSKENLSR